MNSSPFWALMPETAQSALYTLYSESRPPQNIGDASQPAAFFSFQPAEKQVEEAYTVKDRVAIIPVKGVITRNTIYSVFSGKKLTQGQDDIAAALDAALKDSRIRGILLHINSPGGTVPGTKELADYIAEAAQIKPMASYADGLMASAAMWLGSATGRVFAPATASVGSVGVIMEHTDYSKLNEKWGISYSYVTAGKYKAVGNENQPLDEEGRRILQQQLDSIHTIFKADVVKGLKITAPEATWAEGQTMTAEQARELGMVTTIVRDLDSAVTTLRQEAIMDLTTFAAQHPDLLAEIQTQAVAGAAQKQQEQTAAAVKAERENILAMVKTLGGDELSAKMETLLAAEVTPAQMSAFASTFSITAPDAQANDPKAKILAGLLSSTPKAVEGDVPPEASKKSALVADAERRSMSA